MVKASSSFHFLLFKNISLLNCCVQLRLVRVDVFCRWYDLSFLYLVIILNTNNVSIHWINLNLLRLPSFSLPPSICPPLVFTVSLCFVFAHFNPSIVHATYLEESTALHRISHEQTNERRNPNDKTTIILRVLKVCS